MVAAEDLHTCAKKIARGGQILWHHACHYSIFEHIFFRTTGPTDAINVEICIPFPVLEERALIFLS